MKFVSFNTNSIRMRLHQLEAIIKKHAPEVIGIQETKATDEDFPTDAIAALGYHSEFFGQKTHYGVALLSKTPPKSVAKGFDGDAPEAQRRLIAARYEFTGIGEINILNGYFPQGENRKHPTKFPMKAAFYENLNRLLQTRYAPERPLIVMGDMNIAPIDQDIGIGLDNAKRWLRDGKTSFLPEERLWLEALLDWGLIDTFRKKHPTASDRFSWFDYRSKGFEREPKRGLRIDLILATLGLSERLIEAGIDYDIRGMDKPSDHCPIWAEFTF